MPVSFFNVVPRTWISGASETGIACRQSSAYSGTGTSCRRTGLGNALISTVSWLSGTVPDLEEQLGDITRERDT